jgi:short-subunit dehydrogenase
LGSAVHSRNGTCACDNAAVQIQGKTVLLTGATGGIGEAIAHELSAAGAKLIVSGRRADVLERIAADTGATIAVADLADRDQLEALVAAHSEVDILVANAALPASGELSDFSLDEIDRALDVNLRAPVIMSRLLADQMVSRGSGQIVLIASLAGKVATAGSSLYSATKFGLRGFGAGLRADLVGTGVGVSVVFPGFVRDAGMFHDSKVELPGYVGTTSPQDVADAVRSAVENDLGEIDVAPLSVRVATKASELAPSLMGAVVRRLGSAEFAAEIADRQADKR